MARKTKGKGKPLIRISVGDAAKPVMDPGGLRQKSEIVLPELGQWVHQHLQSQQRDRYQMYLAEMPLKHLFETKRFRIKVEGRADGVFAGDDPIIEEVKVVANLQHTIADVFDRSEHPFLLQCQIYCYLYYKMNTILPKGRLLLVAAGSGELRIVQVPFSLDAFESWWERRLRVMEFQALQVRRSQLRKKRISERIEHPFAELRPLQGDMISFVAQVFKKKELGMVQAPTGVGKTVASLIPALRSACRRGAQVVYVTPRNSQFSIVLETLTALRAKGVLLRTLVLTAKEKMCLNSGQQCDENRCQFAGDFFRKSASPQVLGSLQRGGILDLSEMLALGRQFEVCPYYLAHEHLQHFDVIICDYNYVFSPAGLLGDDYLRKFTKSVRPALIVDEAHQLIERTREYFSAVFDYQDLAHKIAKMPACAFSQDVGEFLQWMDRWIPFIKIERGELIPCESTTQFLDELQESGRRILAKLIEVQPVVDIQSAQFQLYQEISDFIAAFFHEHVVLRIRIDLDRRYVGLVCCDASAYLQTVYQRFSGVVFQSATLRPFPYHQDLLGLADRHSLELSTPFPREHSKVMIVPQIDTTFKGREASLSRIIQLMSRVRHEKPGHYLAFFPSYEFMYRALALHQDELGTVTVLRERSSNLDVREIISKMQQPGDSVVFAVQGGVLSEGVDIHSEYFRGVFIVGPAIPRITPEREILRSFYQQRYGKGFEYAYIVPSMIRSVQSAGRLIRSSEKRGVIIYADRRFALPEYAKSFPSWYGETNGLLSSHILSDLQAFWRDESPVARDL